MRRDVVELRRFYAGPLGHAVREMVGRKVDEAWGYANGLDVLALGYATPFLDGLTRARRVVAAMPAQQGVEMAGVAHNASQAVPAAHQAAPAEPVAPGDPVAANFDQASFLARLRANKPQ